MTYVISFFVTGVIMVVTWYWQLLCATVLMGLVAALRARRQSEDVSTFWTDVFKGVVYGHPAYYAAILFQEPLNTKSSADLKFLGIALLILTVSVSFVPHQFDLKIPGTVTLAALCTVGTVYYSRAVYGAAIRPVPPIVVPRPSVSPVPASPSRSASSSRSKMLNTREPRVGGTESSPLPRETSMRAQDGTGTLKIRMLPARGWIATSGHSWEDEGPDIQPVQVGSHSVCFCRNPSGLVRCTVEVQASHTTEISLQWHTIRATPQVVDVVIDGKPSICDAVINTHCPDQGRFDALCGGK